MGAVVNVAARLAAMSDDFLEYVAELCVGANLFESAHGNPFNDGVRFTGKWIFDGIVLNDEIPDNLKESFMRKCMEKYVKEKKDANADVSNGVSE